MPLNHGLAIDVEPFVRIRRDIHAHPELSGEETRTATVIAQSLAPWGYQVHTNIGGHGVVGVLRRGSGTKSIAIRADFDALPIQEESAHIHCSSHPGKMHACGHDGHTAILLAAACEIAQTAKFNGTFVALFQPAEELGHGALRMLNDDLLGRTGFDAIFGLHNVPGLPLGQFGFRAGPFWAATDDLDIRLRGFGGHAGRPHLARDPLVAGAQLVGALQTIVARNVDPIETAVVTVGSFQAGTVNNVIPDTARLLANVRSFSPEVREMVLARTERLTRSIGDAFEMDVQCEIERGSPPVVNDPAMTSFAQEVGMALLGPDGIRVDAELLSYSDDFSQFLLRRPGSYLIVGNGLDSVPLHHPKYEFNDALIAPAARYWRALVEAYLAN